MIDFLIDRGADPNGAVHHSPPPPTDPDGFGFVAGERALHIAARGEGNEQMIRALTRAHADPNATDGTGRTPLIVACTCVDVSVEVVQVLLEVGADPSLAEETGVTALHFATRNGRLDVFEMLFAKSPGTLNRHSDDGKSTLLLACGNGHVGLVIWLLSLGARQETTRPERKIISGLSMAAMQDHVGVARVLISGKQEAVGGKPKLLDALFSAARYGKPRVLRLMLAADGEEGRSGWANTPLDGKRLLNFGAAYCYPGVVSVLLGAGASEAARDSNGHFPRDIVGIAIGQELNQKDRGKEVAVRRMLKRGPAYRARSWAWPAEEADSGYYCDEESYAVHTPPPAPKAPMGVQISIVRPKSSNSSRRKRLVGLIDRYCRKKY